MAELVFYTNPWSRARVTRWMLEEVGAPYTVEIVPYEKMKDPAYLAINPMGKVPAIRHGDTVVTEGAAICAYLADTFPEAGLGPRPEERGAYYRWFFFAGPLEMACVDRARGVVNTPEQERLVGYGTLGRVTDVLDQRLSESPYLTGERFTAADLFVGAAIGWYLQFGLLETRPALAAFVERISGREAAKRAAALDDAAHEAMKAGAA